MHTSSSSVSLSVLSSSARYLCCVGLIYLLQGCTTLGVELVDSAELAELKSNAAPAEETIDEAELDDALSRMVADLERQLEEAAALAKEDEVAPDGTYVVKKGDYLDKIINQTVGSSPLRRALFRRAFVRAITHA